jgi:hypothetical protein
MEMETWKHGVIDVKHGNMEKWEKWRQRDMEIWRHGDMETWRHGDMKTWTWRHGIETWTWMPGISNGKSQG